MIEEFKKQTTTIVSEFKREIAGIRTNRPSPGLIEDIKVSYYGQFVPIKHVGSVGVTPPRELHVQVWDGSAVGLVSKAIESSSLGLSPQVEGNTVRVFLPELSEERRDEFTKHVKKTAEQYRIELRHARDEANKDIQKRLDESEITEDGRFKEREDVQKVIDKANEEIEVLLEEKIKEIKG
jgi:ribosome recycling factor